MGNGSSKERFERATTTGTLTVDDKKVRSWSRLVERLSSLPKLRSMTVSGTQISRPIPHSFTTLSLWNSLVFLDLSDNGLTCACALGSATCLPKTHVDDAMGLTSSVVAKQPASRSATSFPLESLNLSANALHLLPPSLSTRFPRLRRLVCSGNTQPLSIPGSLAHCLGPSASLEVLDLHDNKLESITVADTATEDSPFPSLRELLLDKNCLSGTVTLGFEADAALPVFASLRRLSVEDQQGRQPLQAVDPSIFVHCPGLNSLSLRGNAHEEEIRAALGKSDVYRRWQERQAEVINKKIGAGGNAELLR